MQVVKGSTGCCDLLTRAGLQAGRERSVGPCVRRCSEERTRLRREGDKLMGSWRLKGDEGGE